MIFEKKLFPRPLSKTGLSNDLLLAVAMTITFSSNVCKESIKTAKKKVNQFHTAHWNYAHFPPHKAFFWLRSLLSTSTSSSAMFSMICSRSSNSSTAGWRFLTWENVVLSALNTKSSLFPRRMHTQIKTGWMNNWQEIMFNAGSWVWLQCCDVGQRAWFKFTVEGKAVGAVQYFADGSSCGCGQKNYLVAFKTTVWLDGLRVLAKTIQPVQPTSGDNM